MGWYCKTVYGDELKADVLMTANREYIEVYKFDSGVVLATPEVEVKANRRKSAALEKVRCEG